MKRADIEHLASLARLRLTDDEMANFEVELSSIVSYVSTVSDIAGEDTQGAPQVGLVHNVFKSDEVTNEPGSFTDAILAEMPHTDGKFLAVKKILNTDT